MRKEPQDFLLSPGYRLDQPHKTGSNELHSHREEVCKMRSLSRQNDILPEMKLSQSSKVQK